ncbi:Heat stress transcription factor A-5 [Linum grandiflorum]
MESGIPTSTSAAGGGVGTAPFLIKTYDMVDDSSTDDIVSWSSSNNSFVVWDPPEFARRLLPAYFKHNNFSSFIRQLNTYGFRKSDPERWEFSNEEFIKGQKHLLKNIHRRKPIHSHSHPQVSSDPERAAFDEEIERLSREKAQLQASLVRCEKERSAEKVQLEDLTHRVDNLVERQVGLLSFLEKSVQNPAFVKLLIDKIEAMDVSAYSKKRRLPQLEESRPVVIDNGLYCSSRPEFGNVIHQDFSNKLRLELSPAVSDINLFSHSTQSSNEDGPEGIFSGAEPRDATSLRTPGLLFSAPETLDLSDTGTSSTFKADSAFPRKVPANERLGLLSLQPNSASNDEGDGHISCLLNLSLASCSLQVNKSQPSKVAHEGLEIRTSPELRSNVKDTECDTRSIPRNPSMSIDEKPNIAPAPNKNGAPGRVNDVFWEQFLTEQPGSSENEEASSHYRANPYDEQEDRRSGHGLSRNNRSMEQLSL